MTKHGMHIWIEEIKKYNQVTFFVAPGVPDHDVAISSTCTEYSYGEMENLRCYKTSQWRLYFYLSLLEYSPLGTGLGTGD
jgi:hypothetical protein